MKTINLPISQHNAPSWLEFVNGLRIRKDRANRSSKTVPDIQLLVAKNGKVTIKLSRTERQLSVDEVVLLAVEYNFTPDALTALLTNRKFRIIDQNGVQVNAKPIKQRAAPKGQRRKASKANDVGDDRGQQDSGVDQQQLAGPVVDLLTQVTLHVEPGPTDD